MTAIARQRRVAVLLVVLIAASATWRSSGGPPGGSPTPKRSPDVANIRYGPHERNVFDFWKAKTPLPRGGVTPVVVYFHGGAFRTGDKSDVPAALLEACRNAGTAVISANYRLSSTAPYPAPMLDGARVIQFVRLNATSLGIDPDRIAASGSSAGAGIALWVGYHDDLADPSSRDAVARQSSRVCCLGVDNAQTSYDPRFIRALIGGRAHEHPALLAFFGVTIDVNSPTTPPALAALFTDASPLTHVSHGDPPAILFYVEPNAPLPGDATRGQGIHHPRFGEALKARLEPLGITCVLHHKDEYVGAANRREAMFRDQARFFTQQFAPPPNASYSRFDTRW